MYTTAVPPSFALLAITYLVYLILVIPRIVRLPALLRVLRTLNSAPSRTIQARNHIVRVPAIVRVLWFGTYPHYRGHPTVPSIFFDARLVRSNRLVESNKMQQNVAKTGWELTKVARFGGPGRCTARNGWKVVLANHVSPN